MRDDVTPGERVAAVWLAAVVLAAIVLLYATQLGLGRWQIDEFTYITDHRLNSWGAFATRLPVSPRPVSELLIYLYGACVLALQQPLLIAALGVLWLATVIMLLVAAWHGVRPGRTRVAAALALGLAPLAFTLVTNPVTEAFYWPVAAVAYLPALAGATSLLFLLRREMTLARRSWCGAALLLCALSHEIGAALAIGFAMGTVGIALFATPVRVSRLWWALLPGLAGLAVMAGLVLFRSGVVDLGSDTKPYTGHLVASAVASAWQMAWDFVLPGSGASDFASIGLALAQKLLFAGGFALVWLRYGRGGISWWHGAFVLGLAMAIYFSLLGAYYHYGDLCCERQATTRQWLIELVLAIVAAAAFGRWPIQKLPAWAGPVLMVLPLASILLQVDGFRAGFTALDMAIRARERTWQSGLGPGSDMIFYLPPETALIHGTSEQVATYNLVDNPPSLIAAMGAFFGKATITVCQPWQFEKSLLINGHQFIPACPPHDGPPDILWNTAP